MLLFGISNPHFPQKTKTKGHRETSSPASDECLQWSTAIPPRMKSTLNPCTSQSHHIPTTDLAVHSLSSLDILELDKEPHLWTKFLKHSRLRTLQTPLCTTSIQKAKIRPLQTEFLSSHHLCCGSEEKYHSLNLASGEGVPARGRCLELDDPLEVPFSSNHSILLLLHDLPGMQELSSSRCFVPFL